MTPEQRQKASKDLTLTYLRSYYIEWRLTKVLTNKKLLNERYDFYKDISKNTKQYDDDNGEATIAQEIKHGLYFDSIATCIQYIEDLFALIKASKKSDYFIREIITYNAGKVSNYIKSFKTDETSLARAFHFIENLPFENKEESKGYIEGVRNIRAFIEDLKKFYINYLFFYNQYKHGLAVGMRPHGNKYNEEQIERDKKGDRDPYLIVYDNLNFKAAEKKGTISLKSGIMMAGLTKNVTSVIGELEKHNSLLRFVFPPDFSNFSFNLIEDIAYKTRKCIRVFVANYSNKIHPQENVIKFELPTKDHKNIKVHQITYQDD